MSDAPAWYWDPDDPGEEASAAERPGSLIVSDPPAAGAPAALSEPPEQSLALEQLLSPEQLASLQRPVPSALDDDRFPRGSRLRIVVAAALVVLVLLGAVVEVGGRALIARAADSQIRAAGVAGGVNVAVGSSWWSPSITKLLFTGQLDRVAVDLRAAQFFVVPVHSANYRLSDLDVDVSLRHESIRVRSLRRGSIRVTIDPSSISSFLGVTVTARDGRLYIGGSREPARVRVDGGDLIVTSHDLVAVNGTDSATFPIVDSYLLPCQPSARVVGEFIELKCSGTELPGILNQTIGTSGVQRGDPSIPPEIAPSQSTVLDEGPTVPAGSDGGPTDSVPLPVDGG